MKITDELVEVVDAAAKKYKVPKANLMAIIEVESGGQYEAQVGAERKPVIRWEGHYFDKRLTGDDRAWARTLGLASPKAGAVKNPRSQADRWHKLVGPATGINAEAAFESISWGAGQVMGTHWKVLGYESASDLAANAGTLAGQIELMMRYIVKFKLIDELQRGDFAGFARGYNGSNYRVNKYDTKMAAAARRYSDPLDPTSTATRPDRQKNSRGMLKMGSQGARVRVAQSLLRRAGYVTEVDGDFGPATKKAVRAFQKDHALEDDGIIGAETWRCLEDFRSTPGERPGVPGPAEAISQTPEGREGAATAGTGGIITTATVALEDVKDQISPMAGYGGIIDNIYTAVLVIGVALMLAGAVWALYGWYKANQTEEV